MQGECGICGEWKLELGLCPVCMDFVCLECWALGSRCCIDCKRTREAKLSEAEFPVTSEETH